MIWKTQVPRYMIRAGFSAEVVGRYLVRPWDKLECSELKPWLLSMESFWFAYALPPLIGALIGAITNDVAIRMLFRPYRARHIARWRVPFTPGLIPRERHHIAEAIADTFVEHVFSGEENGNLLMNDKVKADITSKVDELIGKLGGLLNINEGMLGMARSMAGAYVIEEVGRALKDVGDDSDLIKQRIQDNIDNLDVATLEELVMGFSRKQFRHITWFGALLGFTIGLVQVLIFQVFFKG